MIFNFLYICSPNCPGGGMVDTLVSGTSASNGVQVRLLSWAQKTETKRSPFFMPKGHYF